MFLQNGSIQQLCIVILSQHSKIEKIYICTIKLINLIYKCFNNKTWQWVVLENAALHMLSCVLCSTGMVSAIPLEQLYIPEVCP